MNRLAVIICSLIIGLATAETAAATEPVPMPPEMFSHYCLKKYHIDDADPIKVCSQYELTEEQLSYLNSLFSDATSTYLIFLQEKGYKVGHTTITVEPSIYFITSEDLNDPSRFDRKGIVSGKLIVGRYVPHKGWLFLTPRAFENRGDGFLDFPHEIAHFMNDNLHISGDVDEKLAREFEPYFDKKMIETFGARTK